MIFLIWVVTLAPLPWPVTPVMGATFTVNTTADTTDATPGNGNCADSSNNCSLRAAIQEANAQAGANTIVLQSGQTYTLSLGGAVGDEDLAAEDDLDIVSGSTITIQVQGSGVATITRSSPPTCTLDGSVAAGEFRIFHVLSGGNLTLQKVTVTNGCADGDDSPDDSGGGIFNDQGTVTLTNSTISGNSAGGFGGGIFNLLFGTATITLTNSTISGNSANFFGGGIYNDQGTVNASFVTIANNSAGDSGGGIFIFGGTVNIKNSIVGNNTGTNCAGGVTASGTNLDTDGSCGFTTVASTGAGGLNLGPLQVNAPGTTATHALLAGSAAVDFAADCTFLTPPGGNAVTDQRPVSRPQGSMCDVGAYEARGAVSMDGGGHCLFLDTDAGSYQLIRATPPGGIITGQLVSRLGGSVLSFQNRRGEPRLLKGKINFTSGRGSAAMIFPLSAGGGQVIINDPNILSNPTCP